MALLIAQENFDAEIVALVDPCILQERAACLNIDVELLSFKAESPAQYHRPHTLKIQTLQSATSVVPGKLDVANSNYVLETIKTATLGCLSGQFQAMVTGPVNKAIISQTGQIFSGHTEFIAELCQTEFPVMLLANEKMRVVLITTHLPLSKVSETITIDRLKNVISISAAELSHRFGIDSPHLLVCGLNPHAGEQGHMGEEEITTITPALNQLREEGIDITGPVPADTAFTPESLKNVDLVVAMYHDQGLPVLKSHGFGDTVNITLGLPIIRTSVDHGTALDLAGTGKASASSLSCAIHQAIALAKYEIKQQSEPH